MLKISNKIRVSKISQISSSHCGPAVVQMLFSHLGLDISQEEITKEAGIGETIKATGARIDQLAQAVSKLAPHTQMWYKNNASLLDITKILRKHNYPVAVEWQGLFEIEEEEGDDDAGHYSVIIDIDDKQQKIIMADPYKHYFDKDRIIATKQFIKRWWDTNEARDKSTGKKILIKDNKLLFVVIPKENDFPNELGMRKDFENYF